MYEHILLWALDSSLTLASFTPLTVGLTLYWTALPGHSASGQRPLDSQLCFDSDTEATYLK